MRVLIITGSSRMNRLSLANEIPQKRTRRRARSRWTRGIPSIPLAQWESSMNEAQRGSISSVPGETVIPAIDEVQSWIRKARSTASRFDSHERLAFAPTQSLVAFLEALVAN